MTTTTTVEIPADVVDNSETVTDYAYMGHRKPDRGVVSPHLRDDNIDLVTRLMGNRYDVYTWHDVNPNDQRCRFDMVVRNGEDTDDWTEEGQVTHLFHTEYFTRVACCTHDAYYASHYASVTDPEEGVTTLPGPYCDECMIQIRRSAKDSGMTVNESEPLVIGQHD